MSRPVGSASRNRRYIQKININGHYRYFYSADDLAAYMKNAAGNVGAGVASRFKTFKSQQKTQGGEEEGKSSKGSSGGKSSKGSSGGKGGKGKGSKKGNGSSEQTQAAPVVKQSKMSLGFGNLVHDPNRTYSKAGAVERQQIVKPSGGASLSQIWSAQKKAADRTREASGDNNSVVGADDRGSMTQNRMSAMSEVAKAQLIRRGQQEINRQLLERRRRG